MELPLLRPKQSDSSSQYSPHQFKKNDINLTLELAPEGRLLESRGKAQKPSDRATPQSAAHPGWQREQGRPGSGAALPPEAASHGGRAGPDLQDGPCLKGKSKSPLQLRSSVPKTQTFIFSFGKTSNIMKDLSYSDVRKKS